MRGYLTLHNILAVDEQFILINFTAAAPKWCTVSVLTCIQCDTGLPFTWLQVNSWSSLAPCEHRIKLRKCHEVN